MPTPRSFPVLRLLGTTTSPYTRKVRILASAAQVPFEFVDTRRDAGAVLLARVLDPEMWEERATQTIIDGALDAAINRFYLLRDGSADTGYVTRQRERVEAVLGWLDGQFTFRRPCGVATLALGCALDWMTFRDVVDVTRWPGLQAFREAWAVSRIGAGTEPG
jgi:glutathione S-transferase